MIIVYLDRLNGNKQRNNNETTKQKPPTFNDNDVYEWAKFVELNKEVEIMDSNPDRISNFHSFR
ncbi:hypothetical protein DERP_008439 [Dermatophagoides pteronyssinus]|uniref:Uncharacterized protein n=1 Tax=Dermatophagoides pteronyssinus TaxID=6956 RepID=A0ABQ8IVA2_DERPT|nr:hypothetical protein DERP_008439 [Dermatophagoides pteronyssinus]